MEIGLILILLLVLFLPFTVKAVEHNLEIFLFIMGILSSFLSGVLDAEILFHALKDPIGITIAVIVAGLLFKWFHDPLGNAVQALQHKVPFPLFVSSAIIVLGLISSVITAIIAALVLVLIVEALRMERLQKIRFTVIACFSIGLGAALTPLGEPLSTIVVSKLKEDFYFLMESVGIYVLAGILALAVYGAIRIKPGEGGRDIHVSNGGETYRAILVRGVKIYLFVMGLTLLGAGFEPLINKYLLHLSPLLLYWVNMLSAVLDNATLAAAEISPKMQEETIKAILMGLLISGGMLIPGNIPNIIAAGKLYITSRQWARFGVPIGLVLMILFFFFFLLF